ncbi:hypothetical protein [Erwinia psidii]|uniref:hypothetical protein n=1 Tax=Erwinia psidii TaxID=69224 RepID=UPI0018F4EC16|nr:hypothetical protein [Erwinia psidii]
MRNILRIKYKMGLFAHLFFAQQSSKDAFLKPASLFSAKQTAEQSAVMLKNEHHTLPLKSINKLAIIGLLAQTK